MMLGMVYREELLCELGKRKKVIEVVIHVRIVGKRVLYLRLMKQRERMRVAGRAEYEGKEGWSLSRKIGD